MRRRNNKVRLRRGLAVAAVALVLPGAASAGTNVVPNAGFEQGGCGSTPVICGWATGSDPNAYMYQDTANAHSGSASMALGWSGETGGEFFPYWGAQASTDPASCAAIGPGAHPASLWYANVQSVYGDGWVSLDATFYQGAGCSGTTSSASLSQVPGGQAWQQLTGTLIAPPGTQSALFAVGVWGRCDNYSGCWVSASFDDLEVEDAVVTTPVISSFTPGSGPAGTSVDILGADFTGASSVTFNGTPASFTFDSDSKLHATVPSGASTGPIAVTTPSGTATSASSFTVVFDTPPVASFTFSCTALTCGFDGGASGDLDGTIQAYSWSFGDGTSGSGKSVLHTYAQSASYTVTLTVTDNAGGSAAATQTVTLMHLSARGYKVKGLEKVDLFWSGPNRASFDVYRNGAKITSIQATSYTDNLNTKGSATYTYRVCAPSISTCSNEATVSF